MTRQNLIIKYIETLQKIKLYLLNFKDQEFQASVLYLERAIESLKAYGDSQKPYIYKPNPRKKEPSREEKLTEQYFSCPTGKYWVNRRLKNGEPGYCRKYPQRKKQ